MAATHIAIHAFTEAIAHTQSDFTRLKKRGTQENLCLCGIEQIFQYLCLTDLSFHESRNTLSMDYQIDGLHLKRQ